MSFAFHLYSSEGCHLCEIAHALCVESGIAAQTRIIDIVDDETLVEQYGIHIPVLKRLNDAQCLYWPFDKQELEQFIANGTN